MVLGVTLALTAAPRHCPPRVEVASVGTAPAELSACDSVIVPVVPPGSLSLADPPTRRSFARQGTFCVIGVAGGVLAGTATSILRNVTLPKVPVLPCVPCVPCGPWVPVGPVGPTVPAVPGVPGRPRVPATPFWFQASGRSFLLRHRCRPLSARTTPVLLLTQARMTLLDAASSPVAAYAPPPAAATSAIRAMTCAELSRWLNPLTKPLMLTSSSAPSPPAPCRRVA